MDRRNLLRVMALAAVMTTGLNLAGCKHMQPLGANPAAGTGETAGVPDGSWVDCGGDGFGGGAGLQTVYFDYDSATINPEAIAALKSNADMIKRVPRVPVQVDGHCDNRGTQEYNLALGERRALAVRTFLVQCGVPGERLSTISYGSEFPAVPGNEESAWSKNRRVEFNPGK